MEKTWVWSLGWEDPLEKGKATHSGILAWRIEWTIESDTTERLSLSLSVWQSRKEQMLLGKWCWSACSMQGCYKPSICLKKKKVKRNPASFVQSNKVRMPIICHLLYNHAWVSQHSIQAVSMHRTVCTGAKSRSKEEGLERNNLALIKEGKHLKEIANLRGGIFKIFNV